MLLALAGCRFELASRPLPGAGDAPDLAGGSARDLSTAAATDLATRATADLATLAGADLAARPDLAVAPDLAPMCDPPTLASTVGPGPNLAITLSNIQLDGGSQLAHVAPGAQFTLRADYALTDTGAMNVDQILVGFAPPNAAAACLFDAVVTGGGARGTKTVTLTAPTTAGTYTLRFHYGQATSCDLGWWTVNGAPTSDEDFAAICVP